MSASVPDRGFWSGRRVLVTGHTGFKGAWLCLWLAELGARVSGFALAATSRAIKEAIGAHSGASDADFSRTNSEFVPA